MAQNTIYRALNEKLGGRNVSEYVGNAGELFWDPDTGNLRMSDGTTVGGIGVAESSPWAEDIFLGPWVHFVRPDDTPETADVIIPGYLEIARNPMEENGSIYNQVEDDDGGVNTPYNTSWNTDGWGDLTNVKTRYYDTLNTANDGGGWKNAHFEWVMRFADPRDETYRYYLIRFLTWDGGDNNATGAFSWIRREINANAFFARPDYSDEGDALNYGDEIATNLVLVRGDGGGLFNYGIDPEEDHWEINDNGDNAPYGTLWNWDGWDDLHNLESRDFRPFRDLLYNENWYGKIIVGREFIMKDTLNDAYYAIKFTRWQKITSPSVDYPGFSYTRRKIDLEKLSHGLKFEDGTTQTTAYSTKIGGTIPHAPFATAQVEERWINADDIGKIIKLDENTTNEIRIPDTSTLQWPIGGVVSILNMSGNDIYIYKDNDDEQGTIYGSGTGNSSTAWIVPDTGGYNLVTLMKIEQGMDNYYNDYLLVGSGIETN